MLATYKWTIDRYHQALDAGLFDDQAIELLRGDLIVMPPEREPHAYYNSEVGDYLRQRLGSRAKIREAHPITLPNQSEPIPDLAIVKPLGTVYRDRHPDSDDIFWLVEFSSTTLQKDLTEKRDLYAEAGILEYWVVDLNAKVLTVFTVSDGDRYTQENTYRSGQISPLAFADMQIDVQHITHPS